MQARYRALPSVASATARRLGRADLSLAAAGVAYFALLSLAPALAALTSLYGLIGDPHMVQEQTAMLRRFAPADVANFMREQADSLVKADTGALAWSGALSLILALWSANQGVNGFLRALGAFDVAEKNRGLVGQTVVSLAFTVGAVLTATVAIGALAIAPAVLTFLRLEESSARLIAWARWPLLLGAVFAYVTLVYRYGPNRRPAPGLARVWPPALFATILWILGSMALSVYVGTFMSNNATYGSIAGAVGLALWLFVSSLVFLLGGALAGALEERGRVKAENEAQAPAPSAG